MGASGIKPTKQVETNHSLQAALETPIVSKPRGKTKLSHPIKRWFLSLFCKIKPQTKPLNKSIAQRNAVELLSIPRSVTIEEPLSDVNNLADKLETLLKINIQPAKDELTNLLKADLNKAQKKQIQTAIQNLEMIESLQACKKEGGDLSLHLAIISGAVGTRIHFPLDAHTDPVSSLELEVFSHLVCLIEHAVWPAKAYDQTRALAREPKNIAVQMKILNQSAQVVLQKIKLTQQSVVNEIPVYGICHDVVKNKEEQHAKIAQIKQILSFGLHSPLSQDLKFKADIKRALVQLEHLNTDHLDAESFAKEDDLSKDDSEHFINLKNAERLASLIASHQTKGDLVNFIQKDRSTSQACKIMYKIRDKMTTKPIKTQKIYKKDHYVSDKFQLAKAQIMDIKSQKFYDTLDYLIQNNINPSTESFTLDQIKQVRSQLLTIDMSHFQTMQALFELWQASDIDYSSKLKAQDKRESEDPLAYEKEICDWINQIANSLIIRRSKVLMR